MALTDPFKCKQIIFTLTVSVTQATLSVLMRESGINIKDPLGSYTCRNTSVP